MYSSTESAIKFLNISNIKNVRLLNFEIIKSNVNLLRLKDNLLVFSTANFLTKTYRVYEYILTTSSI